MIAIGKMRRHFEQYRRTEQDDGGGGVVNAWEKMAEFPGALKPLVLIGIVRGDAQHVQRSAADESTHQIQVRHLADVNVDDVLYSEGEAFVVQAYYDSDDRKRFTTVLAARNLEVFTPPEASS